MKSFKSIFEQKKIYTRTEMIDWCLKNIDYFDITNATDNEDYLEKGMSRLGFIIDEKKQLVKLSSHFEMHINTADISLPFKFDAYSGINLIAPNLKDFSFKNVEASGNGINMTFYECNDLDFGTLKYSNHMIITFVNIIHFDVNTLTKNPFMEIYFNNCADKSNIHDFSNYDNMETLILSIFGDDAITPINISNLIENENIDILDLWITSKSQNFDITCKIVNKYFQLHNKAQHIMDFTVEMIDAGFEEML